jgi:Kinetochore complex Fta4 of Sim4 subunit, or CENP-50
LKLVVIFSFTDHVPAVQVPSRLPQTFASTSEPYLFIHNAINMAASAPTIIDLKLQFLTSQILALSSPLSPSNTFLTSNDSAEENALRQKSIDEALHKLNGLLKKHNRLAYGPQAKRHVAEQVDRLYWVAGERGVHGEGEEWAEKGVDYRESRIRSFSWVATANG